MKLGPPSAVGDDVSDLACEALDVVLRDEAHAPLAERRGGVGTAVPHDRHTSRDRDHGARSLGREIVAHEQERVKAQGLFEESIGRQHAEDAQCDASGHCVAQKRTGVVGSAAVRDEFEWTRQSHDRGEYVPDVTGLSSLMARTQAKHADPRHASPRRPRRLSRQCLVRYRWQGGADRKKTDPRAGIVGNPADETERDRDAGPELADKKRAIGGTHAALHHVTLNATPKTISKSSAAVWAKIVEYDARPAASSANGVQKAREGKRYGAVRPLERRVLGNEPRGAVLVEELAEAAPPAGPPLRIERQALDVELVPSGPHGLREQVRVIRDAVGGVVFPAEQAHDDLRHLGCIRAIASSTQDLFASHENYCAP